MSKSAGHSLQWRLSIGIFGAIGVTCLVASALSFVWAMRDANEILDGALEQTASLIVSRQITLPPVAAQLPGTEPDNDVLVVRLVPGATPMTEDGRPFPTSLRDGLQTIAWNDLQWRVLVKALPDGARVAIAQQTEVRDEIARHSALRTLLPLLGLLPLILLLVREVVRRTLAPVSRLARHIDDHPTGPAARLPDVEVPTEVQPFVQSIRRLLGELTRALAQQQRFVANAAHELRSPIAALRLQAANVESVLREDGPARQRLGDLNQGIERIQHLLEQLLSMARVQGSIDAGPQALVLATVAKDVLAEMMVPATAKSIDLGVETCDDQACIAANEIDIATMLRNVIGNAIKHSPEGSVVSVSVLREGTHAVVVVEDDGPGIEPGQVDRVFEPFYRGAGSPSPGSGLGLSIVAAVSQRLGGQIHLGAGAQGRGLRFEYRQPLCSPA